jgi:hypothetical protein
MVFGVILNSTDSCEFGNSFLTHNFSLHGMRVISASARHFKTHTISLRSIMSPPLATRIATFAIDIIPTQCTLKSFRPSARPYDVKTPKQKTNLTFFSGII